MRKERHGEVKVFYDTYALYEFASGSKRYEIYFKNYTLVTLRYNLMELFYGLLRETGLGRAREFYNAMRPFVVDFNDMAIENAMLFKLKHKKQKLSYVDCLGYVLAKGKGLIFLTGDVQFSRKRGQPLTLNK